MTLIFKNEYFFTNTNLADAMGRFSQLGELRDEIIDNYEKRHTKPAIGAMCEDDLDLLKRWNWNR